MIVCHCNSVSDRALRRAVREGAGSYAEIGRACGAGTGCGGCLALIDEVLSAEREAMAPPLLAVECAASG